MRSRREEQDLFLVKPSEEICLSWSFAGRAKNKNNGNSSSLYSVSTNTSLLLSGPYGDDVAFIKQQHREETDNQTILFGLADGVSGNRHHGLDPHLFAHTLSMACLDLFSPPSNVTIRNLSSLRGLAYRALRTVEKAGIFGSSTLCLLSLDKRTRLLRSMNLGDSGFMLIRDSTLFARSQPQYHRGSAPFQLASLPPFASSTSLASLNSTRLYCDRPRDGECNEYTVQVGDLLLLASDGLFDNLYEDRILQIVNEHLKIPETSSDQLAFLAQLLVQSANNAHIKSDDILVVLISIVAPCDQEQDQLSEPSTPSSSASSSPLSLPSLSISSSSYEEEEDEQEEPNFFDIFRQQNDG